MFQNSDGTGAIKPEPMPERVLAICQYLNAHRNAKLETKALFEAMCLPEVFTESKHDDIFRASYNVAVELELAEEGEGRVCASKKCAALKSPAQFRAYCADYIFSRAESAFSRMTGVFCEYAEDFASFSKWDDYTNGFRARGVDMGGNDNATLGWRFWAPFLGCGYLTENRGNCIIPNWQQRFADVISGEGVKAFGVGKRVDIQSFVLWLEARCPEIRAGRRDTRLGLAVSCGLRALHALQKIELVDQMDATRWQLYREAADNDFSHVIIRR